MTISYDKLSMLFQTLLDVPMYEGVGTLAHDIARPPLTALDHTMTLTGPPTWAAWPLSNLPILSFNPATPDFLELAVAESTDLNFQAGAFSLVNWIYVDDLSVDRYIIERGLLNTDGWFFYVASTGQLLLVTNQAAVSQSSGSAGGAITTGRWWCVGATRLTSTVRIFINGADVTTLEGTHINPTACARKLHVGIDDTEVGNPWDGYIWRPIVFSRQISQLEMWKIFEMTRGLFGV